MAAASMKEHCDLALAIVKRACPAVAECHSHELNAMNYAADLPLLGLAVRTSGLEGTRSELACHAGNKSISNPTRGALSGSSF